MKSTFFRRHPGLFLSALIQTLLIAFAVFATVLYWIGKVNLLPEFPTKYALTGVLILGLGLGMWGILALKEPPQSERPYQPHKLTGFMISYPLPIFFTSQFLRADHVTPEDVWIIYVNTVSVLVLAVLSVFTWRKLLTISEEELNDALA